MCVAIHFKGRLSLTTRRRIWVDGGGKEREKAKKGETKQGLYWIEKQPWLGFSKAGRSGLVVRVIGAASVPQRINQS